MSIRVMPIKMQIYNLKKHFLKCNADREDNHAEMDNIDFDQIVVDGESYPENLQHLANAYPEYHWVDFRAAEKKQETWELRELKVRVKEEREKHEASYEIEQQQEMPIPEEAEAEPEVPLGDWRVEKTALGELHTIEVEVEPHIVKSKGKPYTYGRIQLTVSGDLLGCRAKISILVPKL
jgi:hypothetical protein